MAATMTRFLPSTSAMAPANGAVSATASADDAMVALIAIALTRYSWASLGNSACGE
jgi:hypothetical protein